MKRPLAAALLLGAATVLGFAPIGLFPLPLLTLALLFNLWRRATAPLAAALLGLAWGLGFFLGGVSWTYISLHDIGGMIAPLAALATLLFCGYLALFPALAGFAFRRLASADFRSPWADTLLVAGLWTLAEWLRGWLFTGFPWLALGYSQGPPSPLAGYVPVLGSYGVTFLVALIAGLLGLCWRRFWPALGVVALVAFGFVLHGMVWTQPVGEPVTVALLQGNVPQNLKWDPNRVGLSVDTYLRLVREHPARLTVMPETAIPLMFDEVPRDVLRGLTKNGEALFGVAVHTKQGDYVNGAVGLTPDLRSQGYAKSHLVPFGEFVPPGFAWFFTLVRMPMSDFTAGPAVQPPLVLAGQKIAPNICYEDLFGEEILRALPAATLLINLSNTAWFGHSWAQPQQLQVAQLRALETGRPMLRATNTGMTAAIAPDGTVLAVLPPFTRGALRVEVRGYQGLTPFARHGNVLALVLAIAALAPAVLRRNRQAATSE
jgi:apolipoprotein N-acyltransferase